MSFISSFPSGRFARVPLEVLTDSRLKPRPRLVLMALLLHANDDGECRPTLATLSEMLDIPPAEVSRATTELVKLGYLTKKQSAYNAPNHYVIASPAYPADALRVVTDKRVSDEDYKKKRLQLEAQREASLCTVRDALGNVEVMPFSELKSLWREACASGADSVGIPASEFARFGLPLVDEF